MNIQMHTIIGFTEHRLGQVLLHCYPSMDEPRPTCDSKAVKTHNLPRQSAYKISGTAPKASTGTAPKAQHILRPRSLDIFFKDETEKRRGVQIQQIFLILAQTPEANVNARLGLFPIG